MTDQDKFEKWFEVRFNLVSADWHISGEFAKAKANIRMGYLAAKQDSADEIAELKAINNGLKKMLELNADSNSLLKEITQLQADNLKLREALEKLANLGSGISPHYGNSQGNMLARQALASTSAQSLQAHDDEVIERCAVYCDGSFELYVGEHIRELKGKP